MKEYSALYYKLPIWKWFFAIAILFSLDGYSNYTSQENQKVTTELVVAKKRPYKKTVIYNKVFKNHGECFLYGQNLASIAQLLIIHTKISAIKTKSYSVFISSIYRHRISLIHNTSYSEEEESFHFLLG